MSEKLLQILIKLLNPQILFPKSETNLQIQKLLPNPEKYFANLKKDLPRVTCASSQPACVWVHIFRNVSLMTLEYVHYV